ncbi:MAG: ABC transporter ATP-binding protein [Candidatus Hodarchaeales archaeon]|jgi:ATP-binding cassette subfamily B protein
MSKKSPPLIQLLRYSKVHRIKFILATIFSILNKLFDLAPPFLIAAAVDIAVRREGSVFGYFGILDITMQLYVLGVLTFIIWFFESLFEYIYKIYWRNLAQTIEHDLRMDAYRHLQQLELEYFEDRQTGGLMAILNDDINQLERFLDVGANDLIQVTVTAITISLAFFLLSPQVAWMAMLPMPFILLFSVKFQQRLESRYADVREKVGILNGQLSNNLTGIATIKSFTNESYEANRIFESSTDYKESNREAIKYSSAFSPLIRMIIVVGFTMMLVFGGIQTIEGHLEVAAYSAMIFLTQRLLWPLTRLGETFDQYQRAMASTTRIMTLLETPRKIISGEKKLSVSKISGKINFQNISFNYKGRIPIFTNFNVDIEPGQTIAFVGSTGAGKSTIVKLLLRFYDPINGKIMLDGTDIKDLDLNDYRRGIGLVNQDTFLIDGTVRENIAYGHPETSLDEIIEAAKVAEVHEFVLTSLPDQYETLVGERGQKLSGGQRQRISIARAVLKNPPILILDEATSSVDNETEAAIQRSLEKIIIDRTTIIIAHRLSTIRKADRIFVLVNGVITEQGTHDELVELDGQYSSLWKVQTGEKLLTPEIS